MKNSAITKSHTGPDYGGSEAASKAYKEVAKAYDLRRRPFAVLQRIARAFLKWDDTSEKSVRRELQNFASMKLSEENTSWFAEKAFRECFLRALIASSDNDPHRPENVDRGDGPYSEKQAAAYASSLMVRNAFHEAVAIGASDEKIKRVLGALDEIKDEVVKSGWQGK
jgi:hypothetical protein